MSTTTTELLDSLSAELSQQLRDRIDQFILDILQPNSASQFARHAPELAQFRQAVAKDPKNDFEFLRSFRENVPLTGYESYRLLVAKFFASPCREVDVENMLALGLPDYLAMSSATTGKIPKIFPKYPPPPQYSRDDIDMCPSSDGATLTEYSLGYREIRNIECENNRTPTKLVVCGASSGNLRMQWGWPVEQDQKRLDLWGKLVLTPYVLILKVLQFQDRRGHTQ